MAGKRLSDNNSATQASPILPSDSFVLANPNEDRTMSFTELTRILHDGADGVESLKFVADSDLAAITTPENAKYRFHDGEIQILNEDDSQWYSLRISASGGRALSWGDCRALVLNSQGLIQTPANFLQANNIVTIEGGLKTLSPGSGILGENYNGTSAKTWSLDQAFLKNLVNECLSKFEFNSLILKAPSGEKVKISAKVVNGIPVLNPEILGDE